MYGTQTLVNWYKRHAAKTVFKKIVSINPPVPYISFTFDDFPQSALRTGGEILKSHGFGGTYYTSLGLLGSDSPSGRVCTADDVIDAFENGHELGCHTFAHCHSWDCNFQEFEDSILKNQAELARMIKGASFRSFSYPISLPHPYIKRACARHFECCRAGGQAPNTGRTDLNQLAAYFLEKAAGSADTVKAMIDLNCRSKGWLIFATHDVSENPSQFGCTPRFFEEVIRFAANSGARILPVVEALEALQSSPASRPRSETAA